MATAEDQERLDAFFLEHGPCCAGCDWWRHLNVRTGECTKSAPVAPEKRYAMLGVEGTSLPLVAGHVLTPHDHHCGDFKDEFDWSPLPRAYQLRVGVPTHKHKGEV